MTGMFSHLCALSAVLLSCMLPFSRSQTLSNLPQCWQTCITNADHVNCAALDVPCVCRAWNGGVLTSVLTCIKSNCDSFLDTALLVSPLELTCDLAGVPISSAVVSSAIQAASTSAVVTSYVTDTVTESYYWQSTFGTIATTVVVPVTGSDGHTLIVAFPVTIEPSTTIYGSPSTSTPDVQATVSSTSGYNFGSCSNPGIVYGYGLDGESQYAFEPADQTQFPRGASPDIASVESFICKRLRDRCQATEEARTACDEAFDAYSGLAGQNAADVWNIALGLPAITQAITTTTVTLTSTTPPTSSPSSSSTSVTTTTTTNPGQSLGDPATITATVTATVGATVGAGGSSGNPNADGGGSPFDTQNAAIQERPYLLLVALGILSMIFAFLC